MEIIPKLSRNPFLSGALTSAGHRQENNLHFGTDSERIYTSLVKEFFQEFDK